MMKDIKIEKVINIINEELHMSIESNQAETTLITLGIDSFKFIAIIVALEREFNCEIPDQKLLYEEMNTIDKIVKVLNDMEIII